MTNLQISLVGLTALAFLVLPNCGGSSDNGNKTATGGLGNQGGGALSTGGNGPNTGGLAGMLTGGRAATGGMPATGGYPEVGGSHLMATGGTYATGGRYATGGAYATGGRFATGGIFSGSGGSQTGGAPETGGLYAAGGGTETYGSGGAPPNNHTCICALADSLSASGCTSNNPNDCTLQKAYCGQTCASQPLSCGTDCIASFAAQGFLDSTTYTSGSCTVMIRCP